MDQVMERRAIAGNPGRPKKMASSNLSTTVMAQSALAPRLLDLEGAAAYLSVSTWTIRDMDAAGVLPRVRVPLANGRDLRKLLFDKADLDRLIAAWKDEAA
jgi:hypothetical protein